MQAYHSWHAFQSSIYTPTVKLTTVPKRWEEHFEKDKYNTLSLTGALGYYSHTAHFEAGIVTIFVSFSNVVLPINAKCNSGNL